MKLKYFSSLLQTLSILSPVVILASSVDAQSACRNVTVPTIGLVCYTEHPFSARQRDEGGTKTWSFIAERISPNWVLVDHEVIREGGFGTISDPTGSVVSANGNASILDVTQREATTLTEIKSQLEAKAQGCLPPVCGQIQGLLSSVSREIERLSSYRSSSVTAGGNEKILFSYTTSVSCQKYLGIKTCGGGASIYGKVKVYQRYLGDPDSLRASSQSLVQNARSVLAIVIPTPNPTPNDPSQYQDVGTRIALIQSWGFTLYRCSSNTARISIDGQDALCVLPANGLKSGQRYIYSSETGRFRRVPPTQLIR